MNHYGKGQIVFNDSTALRVTVGQEEVYGMTEREEYGNPNISLRARVRRYTIM